jgi:mRNA-degrading endonuclease RelE of RelBE toxin-antitoxin system
VAEKKFKILFSPAAQRDIERFETEDVLQLVRDIQNHLQISPLPFGKSRIKKMSGFAPPLYRLRSGNFRAYYRIDHTNIVILSITHKKDSEKILKKLKR